MQKKHFLLVSTVVGVSSDAQKIFNEATLRLQPACDIFLLTSLEEANELAFQRYGIDFYRIPRNNNVRPMALTMTGEFFLTNESSELTPQGQLCEATGYVSTVPIDWGGAWAITGINGFGWRSDLSDALNSMIYSALVYPMARWFPNKQIAISQAYEIYSRRFYTRYSGKTAFPVMPNLALNPEDDHWLFVDNNFSKREEDRRENAILSDLVSNGLMSF